MTNTSQLDEFVGRINHTVKDFKHDGSGGDVMFGTVIIYFLNFFHSALEMK